MPFRNHAEELFYSYQRSDELHFALNDAVRVIDGPAKGSVGAVISPRSFGSDPEYTVELASGPDVTVRQSEMELLPDSNEVEDDA
jgi:hypothetical protein